MANGFCLKVLGCFVLFVLHKIYTTIYFVIKSSHHGLVSSSGLSRENGAAGGTGELRSACRAAPQCTAPLAELPAPTGGQHTPRNAAAGVGGAHGSGAPIWRPLMVDDTVAQQRSSLSK